MSPTTTPNTGPLPALSGPYRYIVGFMRGERSPFKSGYTHTNAALAAAELCDLRGVPLTDSERLLLPCFALGVARGLGSTSATLEALNKVAASADRTAALEAYNSGMIYGGWERRLGDTCPADS